MGSPTKGGETELFWGGDDLAALGILVSPSGWDIDYRNGWATIGTLITRDGTTVEALTRNDLTANQFDWLIALASQVVLDGMGTLERWEWRRMLGWVVRIEMRYSSRKERLAINSSRNSGSSGVERIPSVTNWALLS